MNAVKTLRGSIVASVALAVAATSLLASVADARGRFGGARMPRVNIGGHYNSPRHFGGPGFNGGGRQFRPDPRPFPRPYPLGPGPRPIRPLPPPLPYRPLPPPLPYFPGYYPGLGAAAAFTAGAVAVGTMVASIPRTCESVVVNGVTYRRCDNNWYEPRYQGHNVVYVVVPAPR